MISPIPTPTPDLSWIAHYIPTRTPTLQAMAESYCYTPPARGGLSIVIPAIVIGIVCLLALYYKNKRYR